MSEASSDGSFVVDSGARLSPQIAEWVREQIIGGKFAPHQKLKPEHLATMCGASATPVREALMSLAGEGLVTFAPGRGFAVRQLTRQDMQDLLSTHAHLAALLTERATRALNDDQIERLREIQASILAAAKVNDYDQLDQLDDEFHRVINRVAGSGRLKWLYSTTFRFIPHRLFGEIEGFKEAAVEDHVVILKGLINRNPEAAAAAMRAHWLNVATVLISHMRARGTITDG